jgi:putative holliday junction resolvase
LSILTDDILEFTNVCPRGVILAIDYGAKKIGLAISLENRSMSVPLSILKNSKEVLSEIKSILLKKKVTGIVIGNPVLNDGTNSKNHDNIMKFAQKLNSIGFPVMLIDERRTTKAADMLLLNAGFNRKDRNEMDDAVAANLILESCLKKLCSI